MDITVKRNDYGRQLDSYEKKIVCNLNGKLTKITGIFIRAPRIIKYGDNVEILSKDNEIIFARQGNILVSTFHPEISKTEEIHKYFLTFVKN